MPNTLDPAAVAAELEAQNRALERLRSNAADLDAHALLEASIASDFEEAMQRIDRITAPRLQPHAVRI